VVRSLTHDTLQRGMDTSFALRLAPPPKQCKHACDSDDASGFRTQLTSYKRSRVNSTNASRFHWLQLSEGPSRRVCPVPVPPVPGRRWPARRGPCMWWTARRGASRWCCACPRPCWALQWTRRRREATWCACRCLVQPLVYTLWSTGLLDAYCAACCKDKGFGVSHFSAPPLGCHAWCVNARVASQCW